MTKCKQCNGNGQIFRPGYGPEDCPYCKGTGIKPLTNDDWRKTCSSEEFAKWVYDLIMHEGNTEWYEDLLDYREDTMDYRADYRLIEIWLKEEYRK